MVYLFCIFWICFAQTLPLSAHRRALQEEAQRAELVTVNQVTQWDYQFQYERTLVNTDFLRLGGESHCSVNYQTFPLAVFCGMQITLGLESDGIPDAVLGIEIGAQVKAENWQEIIDGESGLVLFISVTTPHFYYQNSDWSDSRTIALSTRIPEEGYLTWEIPIPGLFKDGLCLQADDLIENFQIVPEVVRKAVHDSLELSGSDVCIIINPVFDEQTQTYNLDFWVRVVALDENEIEWDQPPSTDAVVRNVYDVVALVTPCNGKDKYPCTFRTVREWLTGMDYSWDEYFPLGATGPNPDVDQAAPMNDRGSFAFALPLDAQSELRTSQGLIRTDDRTNWDYEIGLDMVLNDFINSTFLSTSVALTNSSCNVATTSFPIAIKCDLTLNLGVQIDSDHLEGLAENLSQFSSIIDDLLDQGGVQVRAVFGAEFVGNSWTEIVKNPDLRWYLAVTSPEVTWGDRTLVRPTRFPETGFYSFTADLPQTSLENDKTLCLADLTASISSIAEDARVKWVLDSLNVIGGDFCVTQILREDTNAGTFFLDFVVHASVFEEEKVDWENIAPWFDSAFVWMEHTLGFNPFGDSTEAKKRVFRFLGKQLFGEYWGDDVGRFLCAEEGKFCACVGNIHYGTDERDGLGLIDGGWAQPKETSGPGLQCSNDEFGDPAPFNDRKKCYCQDRHNVGSAGGLAISFSMAQQLWLFLTRNNITSPHPLGKVGYGPTENVLDVNNNGLTTSSGAEMFFSIPYEESLAAEQQNDSMSAGTLALIISVLVCVGVCGTCLGFYFYSNNQVKELRL